MKTLCVVVLVCAAAVYGQTPTDPSVATQTQTGSAQMPGQNGNTANSQGNTANNQMQNMQQNQVQTGNMNSNTMPNIPVQNGNMNSNTMPNIPAQNGNMNTNTMPNIPAQNGNMNTNTMQNNPAQNGNMMNNNAQNNPGQSGNAMTNPTQTGHMLINPSQYMQNFGNSGFENFMRNRRIQNFRNQIMQHRMKQNPSTHAVGSTSVHGSTQTGMAPHMLPFLFNSERGRKMALMSMMAKHPALANVLPVAMMNGGLSDKMMQMMLFMGLSENQGSQGSQGQGNSFLPWMFMFGGNDLGNLFPFMMASQSGGNQTPTSADSSTAQGASATSATGEAASASGPSFLDFMMMNTML